MSTVTMNYEQQCEKILSYLSVFANAQYVFRMVNPSNEGHPGFPRRLFVLVESGAPEDHVPERFVRAMWDNRGVEPHVDVPDHQWRNHRLMALTCSSKATDAMDSYQTGRYVQESELEVAAQYIVEYLATGKVPEFLA